MEFIYLFKILVRRKWVIIGAALFSVIIAFLFTFKMKALYKSNAQISTGFTISQEIKLSDNIFDQGAIDVKFNNIIENITSPQVLNLLSYKLILRDLSSSTPFTVIDESDLKDNENLRGLNLDSAKKIFSDKYDSTLFLSSSILIEKQLLELLSIYKYDIETIKDNLKVSRYPRTDYINIEFLSESPELSAFVVNKLVQEFQVYYDAAMTERSMESMKSEDSVARAKKAELDQKIEQKNKFLRSSVTASSDPNLVATSKLNQVSSYESGLADELSKKQSLDYQFEQIELQLKAMGDGSAPVATAPTTPSDNKLYFDLRKQYNNLYDEYVKNGSSDKTVKGQLDDLQLRMRLAAPNGVTNKVTGSNGNSQQASLLQKRIDIEASLRSSNSKIAFYRLKLGEANSIIIKSSTNLSGDLEQLNKEIEYATNEYTKAKERVTTAGSMSDGGGSSFKQTLYGQAAITPEPSKKIIIVGISGFSGLLIASLSFIFVAYFDQSIRTPIQFQRLTGLPLIGTINYIDLEGTTLKDQITQVDANDANRNNAYRELFRKLRYEIESTDKRVIMFTSTEPQQGKTTLLQSLALSLSLSNKKVLLIDTNFCNNDLTVYNKAKPTLERFSATGNSMDVTNFDKLITKTRVVNVDIIGCRGGDYTPSEILPKNHILNYLSDLLKHYDFILMEGAPLNGFTDTKELARYADGIVAIFSAKSQIKPIDKESIKYFKTIPNKFLGAVLNQVNSDELNVKVKNNSKA